MFPHQLAFTFLIPLRNIFLSPKNLIRRLQLKENYTVLEIGPGPGYFSLEVAKAIPQGMLVLADIQEKMLDYAKKRLNKKKIHNVEYHLCNGFNFPMESNKFDVIFMVAVLGEVENKQQYVREILRLLHPGGIFSVSELAGDADKMSVKEIKDLLKNSGLKFEKCYGTKRNFTLNFRKRGLSDIR